MVLLRDMARPGHRRTISLGDKSNIYAAVKYHGEKACDVATQRRLQPSTVITILFNEQWPI